MLTIFLWKPSNCLFEFFSSATIMTLPVFEASVELLYIIVIVFMEKEKSTKFFPILSLGFPVFF